MRTRTFGILIMMLMLTIGLAQADRSIRVAFLPYGTCDTCVSLALGPEALQIGIFFTVSPDGQRLYLKDAAGIMHILSRGGRYLTSIKSFAVSPSRIRAISADGSMVAFDPRYPLRLRESLKSSETDERHLVILKADGTVDLERTEGFNRALDKMCLELSEKYDTSIWSTLYNKVFFFTGDRLGIMVGFKVDVAESGEMTIRNPSGLVVLKKDGSWEGPYVASLCSKRGSMTESADPRMQTVEGQQEAIRSPLYVEYRIYMLCQSLERRWRTIPVSGNEGRLTIDDGYQVVRFKADGQFEGVIAHLVFPLDAQIDYLWDVDDGGNLYYLHFTSEGVEIRMVPSK